MEPDARVFPHVINQLLKKYFGFDTIRHFMTRCLIETTRDDNMLLFCAFYSSCEAGHWDCTDLECPKECTIIGSQHFQTYDGREFMYQGFLNSEYTLIEVRAKNEPSHKCKRHVEVMAWASCQIHKIADCACAGNAGNVFPATVG